MSIPVNPLYLCLTLNYFDNISSSKLSAICNGNAVLYHCQGFILQICYSHNYKLSRTHLFYNYFPQMVELTPGSQVFIYQNLIQQAVSKQTFRSAASFLLNCFYSNQELNGMNLTGANGKPHPHKDIIESIIGMLK